jgi:YHS domain-containing protein
MKSPICPACGCSLVRLRIRLSDAVPVVHNDSIYHVCCSGCAEVFSQDPDRYLDEIKDTLVCPSCLAEKQPEQTVTIEHDGQVIHLCRCPHCREAFEKEPVRLLERLRG